MQANRPIKIVAMGKYLPGVVTSDQLERNHGIPQGWSVKHSGVATRHQVKSETNGFMGARAAEHALGKANMSLADVDMLISAAGTYDYPLPNQASIIKSEMKDGLKYDFPAIDIDTTCLSFVTALEFASCILDGHQMKTILIVSSEIASNGLNPDNWETFTLFGDGAVAAVISFDDKSESYLIKAGQKTYAEGVYFTIIEGGGNRHFFKNNPYNKELHSFKMNGRILLRLARQLLPPFLNWFYEGTSTDLANTDVIVPHQTSKTGMMIFRKMYRLADNQVKESLERYGNCIATSIPLTLCDIIEAGEIKRGDTCLMIGTSAGFSIGAVLIKY